jgi:hypothetical protein
MAKSTKETATKQPKRKNPIPGNKPFKKGQSGNPNGRPKKLPQLDKLLADILGEEKDGKDAATVILMALRAKAVKGDIRAAELLLNRAYGKPKENFNHEIIMEKQVFKIGNVEIEL